METQFPGATDRERFLESVRQLVDDLVSGLIEGTVAAARAAALVDPEGVRAHRPRVARFSEEARETNAQLKGFLLETIYASEALDSDRKDSRQRLTRMFEYLMEHPEKAPGIQTAEKPLHRAVCDFIAGMTDRYFFRVYDSLFGA